MNFIKYFLCASLLISQGAALSQTNDPSDAVGLNAVACEISATLESSVVKTMDKTPDNLQYIDALQKMSDGYFKIKVNEFNAGRLTKERAVKMSDLVVEKYFSQDASQNQKARGILNDCIKLGIKNGVFQP